MYSGPLLGTIDVRGGGLATANEDGEVRLVIVLGEFFLHELHQLVPETEDDVQREGDHAMVQEGEDGRVHHALVVGTGPGRPLLLSLIRRGREVK